MSINNNKTSQLKNTSLQLSKKKDNSIQLKKREDILLMLKTELWLQGTKKS